MGAVQIYLCSVPKFCRIQLAMSPTKPQREANLRPVITEGNEQRGRVISVMLISSYSEKNLFLSDMAYLTLVPHAGHLMVLSGTSTVL